MSNSDDQLVLVRDHGDEDDELICQDRPLDDLQSSPGLASQSDEEDQEHHLLLLHRHDQAEKLDQEATKTASSSADSEPRVDENDDGFRTPTSSDHKIPPAMQCPPAPRKPKPSAKRKEPASPVGAARRNLSFDFSEREFEAMFPSPRADSGEDSFIVKFKKPRRDQNLEEKD